MANETVIKIDQNAKNILITIGISVATIITIIIIMLINFNIEKAKVAKDNYIRGKAETMITDSETLINSVTATLTILKVQIDDTKELMGKIKTTGEVVDEKLTNFQLKLELINKVYDELYKIWKGKKQ